MTDQDLTKEVMKQRKTVEKENVVTKRKMERKKTTKNILVGGTGLMVGSVAMGKIVGTSTNPNVAKIATTGQQALQIGSVAMPIGTARGVMGSLDSLVVQTKRKKKWVS